MCEPNTNVVPYLIPKGIPQDVVKITEAEIIVSIEQHVAILRNYIQMIARHEAHLTRRQRLTFSHLKQSTDKMVAKISQLRDPATEGQEKMRILTTLSTLKTDVERSLYVLRSFLTN